MPNAIGDTFHRSKLISRIFLALLVVALFGFAILFVLSIQLPAEPADFPNEGKLIQSRASPDTAITNISAVIGFAPDVVCFSILGGDPRLIYNVSAFAARRLEGSPTYTDLGRVIFLFVGNEQYYMEKIDRTDISFDDLTNSRCERITPAFSIKFTPPMNRRVYSRFSAFVNF